MKKKVSQYLNDLDAFHKLMQGTKRVDSDKVRLKSRAPKTITPVHQNSYEEKFHFMIKPTDTPVDGDTPLEFKQESISNKILRKLRKGQYNVDAILDLHGMNVEEARIAFDRFLSHCLQSQIQVALVIHGKGHLTKMPVLKNQLLHWLQQTNCVLAFCSAMPRHGGSGATYILLKRQREK